MLEIKRQNITVLGSLNPAILQPYWLVKCGVIPQEKEIQYKFPVGAVIAPIQFKYENIEWIVEYSRLQINLEVKDGILDLGKTISKIFNDLKYTPVRAIGHNFTFKISKEISDSISLFKGLNLGEEVNDIGKIDILNQEINFLNANQEKTKINTILKNNEVEISFNYHRDIDSVAKMIEVSKSYLNDYSKCSKISEFIFKKS